MSTIESAWGPQLSVDLSRDCIELNVELESGRGLTIFLNHLKSKFITPKGGMTPEERAAYLKAENDARRSQQCETIVRLLHERFPGDAWNDEYFLVAGDLNDEPQSDSVAALVRAAGLENALGRIEPESERWTHWYRSANTAGQLDYLLLSPALSSDTQGQLPVIERRGISFRELLQDGGTGPVETRYQRIDDDPDPIQTPFRFERFSEVTPELYASDHCAVFFDVP